MSTTAGPANAEPLSPLTAGRYIVMLAAPPASTYEGGVGGLAATKVSPGEQLDASEPEVESYTDHLEEVQEDVAASVGASRSYSYKLALNGFAADLSAVQAAKLAGTRGVLAVVPDEMRQLDTDTTPEFLGLAGPGGVWAQTGGPDAAGDGVVVGILDSGIWPENASFAGKPLAELPSEEDPYQPYRDGDTIVIDKADGTQFLGECVTTDDWTADDCTEKVVGARYYADGFLGPDGDADDLSPAEFISPRDGDGHGSHTASTAAGNTAVDADVQGTDFGRISGMAPAAAIASYKVCWNGPDDLVTTDDGCFSSDAVAAIDDAILDGVDVINYSISGGGQTVADPVEFAFLSAAASGVFVAASAGNSGPTESTVNHASPWVSTVAASTEVPLYGSVVLGDGTEVPGISSTVSKPVGPAPLVDAAAVTVDPAPADAALCPPDGLDPAQVSGAIVVCVRGVYDRVAKSAEVARAGGIGMILANPADLSLDADLHSVPTVHINPPYTEAVLAYARTEGAAATLVPGNVTGVEFPYPQIAGFSSRGPALAGEGDVLKPDISAPGVGILAAVAPPANEGEDFGFISGTSMSSPHIAGLAAIYLGVHPTWSPMAIKSAMMTTAYDLVDAEGERVTDPFAQGAGHVDPTRFLNPALVYDSDVDDWLSYIQGTGFDTGIPGVEPIDGSDLNQASIAVGALAGRQSITRTVTATTPGLYRASVDLPGVDVRVTPSVLSFSTAGEKKSFRVTFTNRTAPTSEYTTGSLTWQGGRTQVRSPIAVRPVVLDAPLEISGTGAEGSIEVEVTGGYTGTVDVTTAGLAAGEEFESAVAQDEFRYFPLTVPEGASLVRVDTDAAQDDVDLDLVLYELDAAGNPVALAGFSASGSADERIDLLAPEPGDYLAAVRGFSTAGRPDAPFTQTHFVVTPETTLGSPTVEPDPVVLQLARTTSFTYSWSGLDADTPYLGWIGFEGVETPTVVSIN